MATPARKAHPNVAAPRRRSNTLWEALAVFVAAGAVAYAALDAAPAGGEPSSLMALVPEHMKPIDHHFEGCDQARAMGMTNIPVGHPSYREFMDGDGDGLACEPYRGQ